MEIVIEKTALSTQHLNVNAFIIRPKDTSKLRPTIGIFTHGYTSHKGNIINWGTHLALGGIPSLLFDLPGHFLGSFSEVENFEYFKNETHYLFHEGMKKLSAISPSFSNILIGGHSLGSFMALKAMGLTEFDPYNVVGLAICGSMRDRDHNFSVVEHNLGSRLQLVSKALCPENIFSLLRDMKKHVTVKNRKIFQIKGKDDIFVDQKSFDNLKDFLVLNNNRVHQELVETLPHHEAALAIPYIKKFLRDEGLL